MFECNPTLDISCPHRLFVAFLSSFLDYSICPDNLPDLSRGGQVGVSLLCTRTDTLRPSSDTKVFLKQHQSDSSPARLTGLGQHFSFQRAERCCYDVSYPQKCQNQFHTFSPKTCGVIAPGSVLHHNDITECLTMIGRCPLQVVSWCTSYSAPPVCMCFSLRSPRTSKLWVLNHQRNAA